MGGANAPPSAFDPTVPSPQRRERLGGWKYIYTALGSILQGCQGDSVFAQLSPCSEWTERDLVGCTTKRFRTHTLRRSRGGLEGAMESRFQRDRSARFWHANPPLRTRRGVVRQYQPLTQRRWVWAEPPVADPGVPWPRPIFHEPTATIPQEGVRTGHSVIGAFPSDCCPVAEFEKVVGRGWRFL